VANHSVIK